MEFKESLRNALGVLAILITGILAAGCNTGAPGGGFGYDPLKPNAAPVVAPPTAAPDGAPLAVPAVPPSELTSANSPPATPSAPSYAPAAGVPAEVSATMLHVGDVVDVVFSDIPNSIPAMEDTIKEDGTITLAFFQKFHVAGKTIGQLQGEIRERYVPTYWKYLTITIKIADRFYFVGGEVKAPGRQVYNGPMTVLKAIDTVGGFTDFASKGSVVLTRADGKTVLKENCRKAANDPSLDLPVYPGDRIYVKKRWL